MVMVNQIRIFGGRDFFFYQRFYPSLLACPSQQVTFISTGGKMEGTFDKEKPELEYKNPNDNQGKWPLNIVSILFYSEISYYFSDVPLFSGKGYYLSPSISMSYCPFIC